MDAEKHRRELCDGNVRVWIEQGTSIHLRAIDRTDPVELSWSEARELARVLIELADTGQGEEDVYPMR